jgi:hypothetical protein
MAAVYRYTSRSPSQRHGLIHDHAIFANEFAHQAQCGSLVPARLHKIIEHLDSSPQIHPPAAFQHAIWLYLRFTMSFRDIEVSFGLACDPLPSLATALKPSGECECDSGLLLDSIF